MTEEVETGTVETDELPHRHYCEMCGGIWSHADESCTSPRWVGRMVVGGSKECPSCEDDLMHFPGPR